MIVLRVCVLFSPHRKPAARRRTSSHRRLDLIADNSDTEIRFIKPAGRKLGFGFVNWRSRRISRATWMIEAGANPKDVQGQMRHSRIQTTLDIYAQFVPESQRRAIEKTSAMIQDRIAASRAVRAGGMVN